MASRRARGGWNIFTALIAFLIHTWWKRRQWSLRQQLEHYSGMESRPGETLRYYLERVLGETGTFR